MDFDKHTIRFSRIRSVVGPALCCLILVLGVNNIADRFFAHVSHPGWDFTLRFGEISCLLDIRVDPSDIFSEAVHHEKFRPYKPQYELEDNALDFHWCCGYPPWEYTLLLPFSLFSLRTADIIYKGLELAALVGVVLFAFRRSLRIAVSTWKRLLFSFSFLLMPPEAWDFAFKYGNWAILFCAGVACLIVLLDKKYDVLAGLVWAFLMIKPQQGIWFAIPILFQRRFKTFGVAVATCLAASIPPAWLCKKSFVDLILEIPNGRLEPYYQTTLFPHSVFSFANEWIFPNAALFLGLAICLVFCVWATWKWRKEKDWFVFLQPTFFCICAGYPLWFQDRLFFFFPLLFLLEVWSAPGTVSHRIRTVALMLACAVVNPLSWIHHNISRGTLTVLSESEAVACATWALFAFLVFLVQSQNCAPVGESKSRFRIVAPTGSRLSVLRTIPAFLLLSVLTVFLVFVAYDKNGLLLGIDDADIFIGHAETLCAGHSLSYAVNGAHYGDTTSPLWLLFCSLCFRFGLGEPGILVLSLALLLGAQLLWLRILSRLPPERRRTPLLLFAYAIMVLSSAGYVTWMSITLMDMALWGFLVSWMTLALLQNPTTVQERILAAVPFAIAPWACPDALFVIPCGLALRALFWRANGHDVRDEVLRGVVFLVSLSIFIGFRRIYLGSPFANALYTRTSSSFVYNVQQGTDYLLGYLRSGVFPYLSAFCFLFIAARTAVRSFRRNADKQGTFSDSVFLWLWALVLVLPPIFKGGDHLGYCRFFQPVWPLLGVLLVATFASLPFPSWSRPNGIDWARVIVLFAFVFLTFFSGWKKFGKNPGWTAFSPIRNEFEIAENERENGRILTRLFNDWSEKPVLGVISAGGISRTYREKIVDLMGLNNNQIAHHSRDRIGIKKHTALEPELFDSLRVDLMPFTPNSFRSRALKGMLETESFVADWRCGRIRKNGTEEETPPFFVEKGFLDQLLSTDNFSFRDSYRFEDGSWKEIKEDVSPEGQ